jgi:gamma-glutamylcyclotransferase (GGCT)/AIG2-like uncharacterized protein YtfP
MRETPETPMHDLLFVYGSLLSAIAHPQGERLRREADLVGAATIQARLYAVSWYPGVALSDTASDVVHGELYRLRKPAASLVWLDEYESITPGPSGVAASDEYERIIVPVHLDDGQRHEAWLYHYRRPTTGLSHVATGRWDRSSPT